MNKQSNTYTIIYVVVLVVIVGAALAFASMSLKSRQQANEDNDRRRQILASVNITPAEDRIQAEFDKYIVSQIVINEKGDSIGSDAFGISIAAESKVATDKRQLPLFNLDECYRACRDSGVGYIVIEQDTCDIGPRESMAISYKNLVDIAKRNS